MERIRIPLDGDREEGDAAMRLGSSLAVLAVLGVVIALAVLPAGVALGVAPEAGTAALWFGAGLALLAGGLRWAAVVRRLASRGGEPDLRHPVPLVE